MLKKLRLQSKLFLYYSLIVIFVITLSLTAFFLYISSILEKRAMETQIQLTSKTSGQIESFLHEMDRIALYTVSNPTIKEVFSEIKNPENHSNYFESGIDENRKVMKMLISISLPSNNSIMRTSLYNHQGDYISMGIPDSTNVIKRRTESNDYLAWYQSHLQNNNKLLLLPHDDFWSDDKNLIMLSLIREVTDVSTLASYGVVEVQQPYSKLEDLIKPVVHSNIHTYILTETGKVVYPFRKSNRDQAYDYYLENIGDQMTGSFKLKNPSTGKIELITYNKSPFSNWILIQSEEENRLLSPVKLIGLITLLTGLGLILVTLIVIFILTNILTKPLRLLRNSVKEVTLDNLSIDISHPGGSNEIIELNVAFDTMFTRLKESMSELVQTRAHEIKAHMIALQSQMDPHFLFNMLSIVSASSRDIGASKITDICQKLSGMLRYSTSYNEDFVPLTDEINHVTSYLSLMKIRYEDQFYYEIIVDDNLNNLKTDIPKLTLQPLVENCFQHGFKKVLPPWHLTIKTCCDGDLWHIEVIDNGIGIEEEKIQQLLHRVEEFIKNPSINIKELKLGGMGLINTLVRFRLLYKDKMVLSIAKDDEGGTKIIIGGAIQ